jgi:hypothetical protein
MASSGQRPGGWWRWPGARLWGGGGAAMKDVGGQSRWQAGRPTRTQETGWRPVGQGAGGVGRWTQV